MYSIFKKFIISSTIVLSLNAFAETEIDLWSFTKATDPFIEQFNKDHPDIKINFTHIPYVQYPQKLMAALRSPKTAPTIFAAEVAFVDQFVRQNIWMPLDDFDEFKGQKENFLPYVWNVALNDQDQFVATTWQAAPVGFFYDREKAKQVLGTDDYKEVSEKLSSFDDMLKAVREFKQNTGDSVYLFWGESGLMAMVQSKYKHPFVADGKLTTGPMINELFDLYIKFAKENAIIFPETDDPLFKAIEQNKVLGVYTASWFLGSKLKGYRMEDSGNWGLASSPYPAIRGGIWFGISKTVKDEDKIAAARTFLGDLTTNVETSQKFVELRGDFPANKVIFDNIKGNTDEYLGGQSVIEPLAQGLEKAELFSALEDRQIRTIVQTVLEKIITNPDDWTVEKAVNEYKKQAALVLPDIIVK